MHSRLILDNETARTLDLISQKTVPSLELMERAALAATDFISSKWREMSVSAPRDIAIFAGPGNNGGDALAVARLLDAQGIPVRVYLLEGRQSPETTEQLAHLNAKGISVGNISSDFPAMTGHAALIVDGLFGIGLRGRLDDTRSRTVREFAAACDRARLGEEVHVVSLDIPSGLHDGWAAGEAAVRADTTLCFGNAKECLYRNRAVPGNIVVLDIGFPPEALAAAVAANTGLAPAAHIVPDDLRQLIPEPSPDIHKYRRGLVQVYAGAPGYTGAAQLTANAASLAMAGMVRLSVDDELAGMLHNLRAGIVLTRLSQEKETRKTPDAVVAGPGWGRSEQRRLFLRDLLRGHGSKSGSGSEATGRVPVLVLDADALFFLPGLADERSGPADEGSGSDPLLVLTPHHGELAALAGVSVAEVLENTRMHALAVARRFGAIVVAKGAPTRIVDAGGSCLLVDEANPALAVAGSGDVLAGIVGAQIALALATETRVGGGPGDSGISTGAGGYAGSGSHPGATTEKPVLRDLVSEAVSAAVLIHAQTALSTGVAWPDAAGILEEIPHVIGRYRSPKRQTTMYN